MAANYQSSNQEGVPNQCFWFQITGLFELIQIVCNLKCQVKQIIYKNNQTKEMIWFPFGQNPLTMQNMSQLQMIEVGVVANSQQQTKNYGQLVQQCKNLQKENQQLRMELECLKGKMGQKRTRKIKRRQDSQLIKNFHCLYPNCKKQYASELALNLHMKLKHNAGSKRDRNSDINRLLREQAEGLEKSEMKINLPPECIENMEKCEGLEDTTKLSQKNINCTQQTSQ